MAELRKGDPVFTRTTPLASGIPLGGLGTGSVEIMDTGRFHDWEIFNNYQWSGNREERRPEMWSEDSFFALRVHDGKGPSRVRLLYLEDDPTMTLSPKHDQAFIYNFPFIRNILGIEYTGRYPFARLKYIDRNLPVETQLEAFSPFIPHNAKDSGLPLAFFRFTVRNTDDTPCETSLMFSLRNCTGYDREELHLSHSVVRKDDSRMVLMRAADLDPDGRTTGTTAVTVLGPRDELSHVAAWTGGRGGTEGKMQEWDDEPDEKTQYRDLNAFYQVFRPFQREGRLPSGEETWSRRIHRLYPTVEPGTLHAPIHRVGWAWSGAVGRTLLLQPGEEAEVVFVMSWYYPNHYDFKYRDVRHGHMYENWFSGADEAAQYGIENFRRLYDSSRAFSDGLYEGTLPEVFSASLNAQLTTLAKSTFWTKRGDMALWEGQSCCQAITGGRTPWSSQALLFLFPDIYLNMVRPIVRSHNGEGPREIGNPLVDLRLRRRQEQLCRRGDKTDRVLAGRFGALGYTRDDFAPPRRGSEGSAKLLLFESRWSGDRTLLQDLWPLVKAEIDQTIEDDTDGDGLPSGLSGLTYDHWVVPSTNCYRCSMWLADLRAAAKIAEIMGEDEAAGRYREVLQRGMASFEKMLWNGEYYSFCYDPKTDRTDHGCMADQVSGQLFTRLLGLDSVHDEERIVRALQAVRKHNLLEEEGLINGSDPEGREDWRYFAAGSPDGQNEDRGGQWPTPWTGTEYYVAAVMAAEGLWREAMAVIENVYERHLRAGMIYNHIECGEHYFRALAVWSILPAIQGLVYDGLTHTLEFIPKTGEDEFESLFILPGTWGRVSRTTSNHRNTGKTGKGENAQNSDAIRISIDSGELTLTTITIGVPGDTVVRVDVMMGDVTIGGDPIGAEWRVVDGKYTVLLPDSVTLRKGEELVIVSGG